MRLRLALVAAAALLLAPAIPAAAAPTGFTVSGHVLDASGAPVLKGNLVQFASPAGAASTMTAADGSYSVQLPAGTYRATFGMSMKLGPGLSDGYVIFANGRVTVQSNVVDDIRAPAFAALTVHVLNEMNNPLGSGVQVSATATATTAPDGLGNTFSFAGGGSSGTSVTDGTGSATIRVLSRSLTTLDVTPPGDTASEFTVGVPTDPTTVTVRLPPRVVVSGVLTDGDGNPVAYGSVEFSAANWVKDVSTDYAGRYQIYVRPGRFMLTSQATVVHARARYSTTVSGSFDVPGDMTEDIQFPPVADVHVHVHDERGMPVAGAQVRTPDDVRQDVTRPDGSWLTFDGHATSTVLVTDANGNGETAAMVGTDLKLEASAPPLSARTVIVPVLTNPTSADLTLSSTLVTLSGHVSDDAGLPVEETTAELTDEAGTRMTVPVSSSGDYSVAVPAGAYVLRARRVIDVATLLGVVDPPGTSSTAVTMDASGRLVLSADRRVDIAFPSVARLTVNARDGNARPVPGVEFLTQDTTSDLTASDGTEFAVSSMSSRFDVRTDVTGAATVPVPLGSATTFYVTPPNGFGRTFTASAPDADSSSTLVLDDYTRVDSAGSTPGQVLLSVPEGMRLSDVHADPTVEIPAGTTALVGAVSYRVSGLPAGGSTDVSLGLPGDTVPTSVYELRSGEAQDATARSTVRGESLVLHVTDGGAGDGDGVADGRVVDTVVPVIAQATAIATGSVPRPTVGVPYQQRMQATGVQPITWSVTGGRLPRGLSLSAAGVLSGTATTVGRSSVTFTAHGAHAEPDSRVFTVDVAPMSITTASVPAAHKGVRYRATLRALGGFGAHAWQLRAGALPPGLRVTTGGQIVGVPGRRGSFGVVVRVTDSGSPVNVAERHLTVVVR